MASTDASAYPIKNAAWRVTFPILDADGDLVTGAATLDSEISKDGGTFADCTNEATEIATSSGVYYLDLTSTEMNADTVAIIVKTGTAGAKTTTIVTYPITASTAKLGVNVVNIAGSAVSTSTAQLGVNVVNFGGSAGTFASGIPAVNSTQWAGAATGASNLAVVSRATAGTMQAGSAATTAVLASGSSSTDGQYYGSLLFLTGGTGAGQSARIKSYVGATRTATIDGSWAITPDNTTTYTVLPGGGFDAVNTAVASVTTVTGNVNGSVGSVTGAVGSVTGAVGSVTGAVGSVTGNVGGNVTGSVGSLAAQAKADVNAEVVDALATDTYAEPGQGAPAATATIAAKVNYLYKAWRNKKEQTSTTWSLYDDAGTTVDQKSTVADDGTTASRAEVVTGP